MKLLVVLVFFLGSVNVALAQDEIDFLIGDWNSFDDPFRNDGVRIARNEDGSLNLKYCDLWKLRFTGDCEQRSAYEGTIELDGQSIVVTESAGSPNPSYSLAKDPDTSDKFIRKWGNLSVVYRRIR